MTEARSAKIVCVQVPKPLSCDSRFATSTRLAWPAPFLRGRGGIGRRAALRSLWGNSRGSSSLLGRTRNWITAPFTYFLECGLWLYRYADVAELVDALASGASGLTAVEVRVLSSAPNKASWLFSPLNALNVKDNFGVLAPQNRSLGMPFNWPCGAMKVSREIRCRTA